MKPAHLITGIVAGVTAGLIVGVLFAPDKGTKTRHKIASKGGEYKDKFKEKFDGILDKLSKKYGVSSQEAKEMLTNAEAKLSAEKA